MNKDCGLLIVDVQKDFCPGGALPVARGGEIVPVINRYVELFAEVGGLIVASRDWHPRESAHFQERGGPWPRHCVQGTPGAEFHDGLRLGPEVIVVSKGTGPDEDGYSAFAGRTIKGWSLASLLTQRMIQELYVCGLATDYCVKSSCLDALRAGYRVSILIDAIRGVDLHPGDSAQALADIFGAGAHPLDYTHCLREFAGLNHAAR